MSWFERIEEACASFIERTFASMFPSDLEPAQIARRLVTVMEARTEHAGGGMSAPAAYAVRLSPVDFERLKPHQAYLEGEWAALLRDVGRRAGISLGGVPSVALREDASVTSGAFEIDVLDEPSGGAQQHPRLTLRVLSGMPAQGIFALHQGVMHVGRNPENEIFLVDPSVSRRHAVVDVQGDHLLVRDAGSSNGTFVNGERVQLRTLHPGDRVAFGKTVMLVEAEGAT
jgi:hypothetical protein